MVTITPRTVSLPLRGVVMKLSACIEWLFADETDDISQRVRNAAECGLYGVEFHLWRDKPLSEIRRALDETGLVLTSFCVDPRRSIVDRAQRNEFLQAVRESMDPARQLGCNRLIIASGFELKDVSRSAHFDLALESLAEAAQIAGQNGATLLLEPLNTRVDHPGMYLNSVSEGLDLVEAVNSAGLRLVYDAYHSIVMGDDIHAILKGRMQWVGHIQVADMPGRGAPGTGEIDWAVVRSMLEQEGYQGAIGLEYKLNGLTTRTALESTRRALGT
jgi:hydroxypyruvate isomerase